MNTPLSSSLRQNVSMLGHILGQTIAEASGSEFLEKIELIRKISKSACSGVVEDIQRLRDVLDDLQQEELLPVARAFGQFLNLANISDQHHILAREMDSEFSATQALSRNFEKLLEQGKSVDYVGQAVQDLSIELVLTAHPTEITRRSLIHKHGEIDACLALLELKDLTRREREVTEERLRELIAQIWHTNDFRSTRPTPVDEARWGFAVVENSLWQAVPEFLRRLDKTMQDNLDRSLELNARPVKFTIWMGGDRDGNPNVTAPVTDEVLLLSRWQAAHLYLKDIVELIEEVSMAVCDDNIRRQAGDAPEPYRAVLRSLRDRLRTTLSALSARLDDSSSDLSAAIADESELWQPLHDCYQSLCANGMSRIANGKLLDMLRRVRCFGVHLVSLDIRQDSDRHAAVWGELTRHLGLGDYEQWNEEEKQAFLLAELASKRPLIPRKWQPSADVQEVLDTCRVIASQPLQAFGCYIISMARQPSDILAVELLLKTACVEGRLQVVPLFETLDDLNRSESVVQQILSMPDYRRHLDGRMMVMIGYSDSAKDAGVLAASWAQYQAQESLLRVCDEAGIELTLFHGRGGSIGRGGAPAHAALLSQPPGSLKNGLRVTEQGEMIRTKLGLQGLATKTLALYTSAILEANLAEPPVPNQAWRDLMDDLSDKSCKHYRALVRDNEDFVAYFRQATPEQELSKLPLGSRPARRKAGGGISSLRAIPWIFAWTQNRLMLPAWLGAGQAFAEIENEDQRQLLRDMVAQWPFFATRLSMLEMVYAKADSSLSEFYDQRLVEEKYTYIGKHLRTQLVKDTETILTLLGIENLLDDQLAVRESIGLRRIYTDPLNLLQAELLDRYRKQADEATEQAVMITIAGVAAGMRNTG
nr:putative phosphoenolpyruvate carboxylase [uncultured bacterium]